MDEILKVEAGGWKPKARRWKPGGGLRKRLWLLVLLVFGFVLLTSSEVKAQELLPSYVTEASANNPGLQAQYTAFEASLERAAQVSGLPNPTLSFGYFIQPVETRVGPQRARFSLNQMFPWFGSLSAKGDAAAARAQAQYLQFIDAREKFSSEVKTSYYQLWEINEMLELERENLRILESYEDLATTRIRSGNGKLSSVYRVQMQIQETKTKIKILEDQILPLTRSFNRLLNREAEALVNISDTIETESELLIVDSVNQHPSILQLQEMRSSAEYQASAASKSGLPSFGLGLDYVLVDERPDMVLPDNGKDVIMPMVSVSLPIWRKQYSAARREAELQQKQYSLQADEVANDLNSKLDMSLFKVQQARDEMRLYNEEIALARKTLELTISDYTNDREDFEEILRLQQKIVQYQKQRVKAYSDYLAQLANLEYLTYQSTDDFQKF